MGRTRQCKLLAGARPRELMGRARQCKLLARARPCELMGRARQCKLLAGARQLELLTSRVDVLIKMSSVAPGAEAEWRCCRGAMWPELI